MILVIELWKTSSIEDENLSKLLLKIRKTNCNALFKWI